MDIKYIENIERMTTIKKKENNYRNENMHKQNRRQKWE